MKQEDAAGGGSHTRAHACDFADNSIATGFRIYFSNVKKKPLVSQYGTQKKTARAAVFLGPNGWD